jgi:hypothetical protein
VTAFTYCDSASIRGGKQPAAELQACALFARCAGRSDNQARSTPWQWPQGRPLYVGGGARETGRCGPAGAAARGSLVNKLAAEHLKCLLLLRQLRQRRPRLDKG